MRKRMCRGCRSLRVLVGGLVFWFCLGFFISVSIVGATNAARVPLSAAAVTAPAPAPSLGASRGTGGRSSDPFRGSKRRVPNGPDPIHNRRAGRLGRPPVPA